MELKNVLQITEATFTSYMSRKESVHERVKAISCIDMYLCRYVVVYVICIGYPFLYLYEYDVPSPKTNISACNLDGCLPS